MITLDHHLYDAIRGWSKQSSTEQPYLTLTAAIPKEDYTHFGARLDANTRTVSVPVIADTGCQSCLAGMNMAHSLGLKQKDLIPAKMKMNTANKEAIGILGAFFVRLLGKIPTGARFQMCQICYVMEENEKFFLPREACHDLGLIPELPYDWWHDRCEVVHGV